MKAERIRPRQRTARGRSLVESAETARQRPIFEHADRVGEEGARFEHLGSSHLGESAKR